MLIVSQTIFYIVSSLAIVVVAVLLIIMIYYLICILRDTKNITDDVSHSYLKFSKSIKKIISLFNKKNKNEKTK